MCVCVYLCLLLISPPPDCDIKLTKVVFSQWIPPPPPKMLKCMIRQTCCASWMTTFCFYFLQGLTCVCVPASQPALGSFKISVTIQSCVVILNRWWVSLRDLRRLHNYHMVWHLSNVNVLRDSGIFKKNHQSSQIGCNYCRIAIMPTSDVLLVNTM